MGTWDALYGGSATSSDTPPDWPGRTTWFAQGKTEGGGTADLAGVRNLADASFRDL